MSIKNPFTDYGIKVKTRLLEMGKTQNWLIQQLKEKTGMFVDSSSLNKVLTGQVNSERITSAINELIFESKE